MAESDMQLPFMNKTHLDVIFASLGIVPSYMYNERVFYDTKDVFERHNFARDVKRTLSEDEWVQERSKYYLSAYGVITFGMKNNQKKLIDAIMEALRAPCEQTPAPPLSPPWPQTEASFASAPPPLPSYPPMNYYYNNPPHQAPYYFPMYNPPQQQTLAPVQHQWL